MPIDDEGYILRTKIKREIKNQDYVASVQAEVDTNRIWFRVATVKKTKDRVKDSKKLDTSAPVYIAYYPGEPYYYSSTSAGPKLQVISQAVVSALGCGGERLLQLSGKNVSSLRKMRLGRDARDGPSSKSRPEQGRFNIFNTESQVEETLPLLDKLEIKFRGPLQEFPGLSLDCRVEVVGSDVIGGLMDMVDQGLISDPPPAWLSNLSTAGRNTLTLNTAGAAQVGHTAAGDEGGGDGDWDRESVLSTATWV